MSLLPTNRIIRGGLVAGTEQGATNPVPSSKRDKPMIGRLLISLLLLIPVQFLAADRSSSGATVPVQEAKEEASAQPSHGVLTLDYVVREALAKNPAVESA